MGNSNSNSTNSSLGATSSSGGKVTSTGNNYSKSSHNRHNSSSSSANTAAFIGTLSYSVASSLTTDTSTTTTTNTEHSSNGGGSSLGTSANHSAATTDEENHGEVRGPYYENHQLFHHHHQLQQQKQHQKQHHLQTNANCSQQYNKQYTGSTDSFNVANFVDSHGQQQHQQQHQGSHYSFSDAGLHTASSFELIVQPTEHANILRAETELPLSLLPQYRPHSVLGLNEQLHHHSMSSCASSIDSTSTDSCCSSGGEHFSLENEDDFSSHYSRIERYHHHQTPAAAATFVQSRKQQKNKKKNYSKQGIRVAVMPLPRSKSFHQILRPTANGHILASNGTIRGASKQKLVAKSSRDLVEDNEQKQSLQPLANRVKQLFGPKTGNNSKNNSSVEQRSELESILQARLSKSESNLHYRHVNRAPSVDLIAEQQHSNQNHYNQNHHFDDYHPHHQFHFQQQQQQQPRRASESFRKSAKFTGEGKKVHESSTSQIKSNKSVPAMTKPCYVPNSANVNSGSQSQSTFTSSSPIRTGRAASKEGSISKHSAVGNVTGNVGAVASKIQRVKQYRNQSCQQNAISGQSSVDISKPSGKQRDLSPLSKMAFIYLSSSTQEIQNDIKTPIKNQNNKNSDGQKERNCKIKRSVSNFDASVYFRQQDIPSAALSGTAVDNPWKLKKPNYEMNAKNGVPDWYSQYLSFEFLNERIKSRLQEEINHQRRSISTDSSSMCDYSRQDSTYQTSKSEDSKQHPVANRCLDRKNTKLSCSEANLSTPNTPKTKAKGYSGLGKRKSFKKLIEQYFVHNNSSCDSSTSSLVSTAYANDLSTFAQFDQNFILKRNTPNAGLSEQKFQQQSNIKEYFDNEQSIYERTWRKKRSTQSTTHSSNLQCQANSRHFSTIDRQLQMFENILNQAENQLDDHDKLIMNLGDSNGFHKSNLSLAEQTNGSEFVHSNSNSSSNNSQLQYLKFIGKSENSLCANNFKLKSKTQNTGRQQREYNNQNTGLYWTPLNDLSSESEFEDEFEYNEMLYKTMHQPKTTVTELLVENLVDIGVEDFNCHQFRATEPPLLMPRQHLETVTTKLAQSKQLPLSGNNENNTNDYKKALSSQNQSPDLGKSAIHQLPSGPCFTLSNQLKTLLHNSNRLKSQNYFFY